MFHQEIILYVETKWSMILYYRVHCLTLAYNKNIEVA